MKKITRLIALLLAVFMMVSAFAACGTKEDASTAPEAPKTQEKTEETTNGDATAEPAASEGIDINGATIRYCKPVMNDEKEQALWDQILADYKEKSGVTVQLECIDNAEYRTWITTQFAAGSAPDVINYNYNWGWEDLAKGYVVDFTPYMDMPNPYFDGKTFGGTIAPNLIHQATSPDTGALPGLPSLVQGVKIIYNKDLFKAAGITEIPYTYPDFLDACQKLKDSGVIPMAFPNVNTADNSINWWLHNYVSQMDADKRAQMDVSNDDFVTKNEIVAGTKAGLIDFTQSPYIDALNMLKDFVVTYCNSDFNGADRQTCMDMLMTQDVAMMMIGSWEIVKNIEIEDRGWEYGIFPFPALTEENYPTVTGYGLNNGARVVDVYAMSVTEDTVKQAAALDFIQYMLAPEYLNIWMNEYNIIPSVVDIELSDKLAGWLLTDKEDWLHMNYFGNAFSKEFCEFMVRTSQIYLTDGITTEEFAEQMNREWNAVCEKAIAENGWTEENGYGTK